MIQIHALCNLTQLWKEKSKMATKMAAKFLENGCIHQISNHNMILLGFWTQNNYIRREEIQTNGFMSFIVAKHQKNSQGPEHYTTFVKF